MAAAGFPAEPTLASLDALAGPSLEAVRARIEKAKKEEVTDTEVLAAKAEADAGVRAGKYREALEGYASVLALLESKGLESADEGVKMKAACHGNRALCSLKLEDWANAERSATKAIDAKPGGTASNREKCLYRRALARQAMGVRLAGAVEDCHAAMKINPKNPLVLKLWMELKTQCAGAKGTATADVDALVDTPHACSSAVVPAISIRVKTNDPDDGPSYARAVLAHPLGWPAIWRGVVGDCGASTDGALGPLSAAETTAPDRVSRLARVAAHPTSFVAFASAAAAIARQVPPEEFRRYINALAGAAPLRAERGLAARAIVSQFCRMGGDELRDAAEQALANVSASDASTATMGVYANPGEGKVNRSSADARAGDAVLISLNTYARLVTAIAEDVADGAIVTNSASLLTAEDSERWCLNGLRWALERVRLDASCPPGTAAPTATRLAAIRLLHTAVKHSSRARAELVADDRMLKRIASAASGVGLASESDGQAASRALVSAGTGQADEVKAIPTLENFEAPLAGLAMALAGAAPPHADPPPLAPVTRAARDVLLHCIARHAGIFDDGAGGVDPASTLEGPVALIAALLLVEGSGGGRGVISTLSEHGAMDPAPTPDIDTSVSAADVAKSRDGLLALAYLGLPPDLSSDSVRAAPASYAAIRAKSIELLAVVAGTEEGRDALAKRPACLNVLALATAESTAPAVQAAAAAALARFAASKDRDGGKSASGMGKEGASALMDVAVNSAIQLLRGVSSTTASADRAIECLALATTAGMRGCVAVRDAVAADTAALRGIAVRLAPPPAPKATAGGGAAAPSPSYMLNATGARGEGAANASTYLAVELAASLAQSLEEMRRKALAEKGIDAAEYDKVMELQAKAMAKGTGTDTASDAPETDSAEQSQKRRQALADAGVARGLADVLRAYRRNVMQPSSELSASPSPAPSANTARLAASALKDLAHEPGTRGRLASDGVLKACALVGSMGNALSDADATQHDACRHDALWCAARVLITTDPRLLDTPMLLGLCGPMLLNAERSEQDLCCFESLLALTNLAGLPEPHQHAERIADLPTPHLSTSSAPGGGGVHVIYKILFKEHTMIRRAALELLCNLSTTEAFMEYNMPYDYYHNNKRPHSMVRPNEDALKLFVTLVVDMQDDPKSARALVAMLSSLCIEPAIASRLCAHKLQGPATFVALLSSADPFLVRRALACVEHLCMSVPQMCAPVFSKLDVGGLLAQLASGDAPAFVDQAEACAGEGAAPPGAAAQERRLLRDSARHVQAALASALDAAGRPAGGGCL